MTVPAWLIAFCFAAELLALLSAFAFGVALGSVIAIRCRSGHSPLPSVAEVVSAVRKTRETEEPEPVKPRPLPAMKL